MNYIDDDFYDSETWTDMGFCPVINNICYNTTNCNYCHELIDMMNYYNSHLYERQHYHTVVDLQQMIMSYKCKCSIKDTPSLYGDSRCIWCLTEEMIYLANELLYNEYL